MSETRGAATFECRKHISHPPECVSFILCAFRFCGLRSVTGSFRSVFTNKYTCIDIECLSLVDIECISLGDIQNVRWPFVMTRHYVFAKSVESLPVGHMTSFVSCAQPDRYEPGLEC